MAEDQPFRFALEGERLVDETNAIEIGAFGGPEYTVDVRIRLKDGHDPTAGLILNLYVDWSCRDGVLQLEITDSMFGLAATNSRRAQLADLLEAAFPRMLDLPYWRWAHSAELITLSVPTDWRKSLLNPPTYRRRLWRSLFATARPKALQEVARRRVEPIVQRF